MAADAQQSPLEFEAEGFRFRVELVAEGLRQPTALVFLPDGRALLVQRQVPSVGILDLATGQLVPLQDGPVALIGQDKGTQDARRPAALTGEDAGLHDLVLHPDYAKNGWIYLSYSDGTRERSTTVVDRFRIREHRMVDRERIFTANAYSEDRFHYGGRMVFSGGDLFLSVGDRHHQDWAQELTNHAGKILRIHDDGRTPSDNPFSADPKALREIWSYGHRNAQGLAVHPETGELWLHEHGPMGGDELNLVKRGANYGWPVVSYGWQYAGGPIGMGITRKEGTEQPLWVWTPAIAPSGMFFYTGDKFPQWRGSLFVGAMAAQHINRIVLRAGRVVVEERLGNRALGRVRMVAQGPDGLIYFGTDGDANGKLYRMRPTAPQAR